MKKRVCLLGDVQTDASLGCSRADDEYVPEEDFGGLHEHEMDWR